MLYLLFLPDFIVTKLLLDSAHDAMPIYEYCKQENITPFIDAVIPASIPALIQNMAEQFILP